VIPRKVRTKVEREVFEAKTIKEVFGLYSQIAFKGLSSLKERPSGFRSLVLKS